MELGKLSRADWITIGLSALLAVDLVFLPWWSIAAGFGPFRISDSVSATGAPNGWLGVIGVIAALALLADLLLERLGATELPSIADSRATTRFMLALSAAFCVAFKFVLHVSFTADHWDVGFFIAVVAAAALLATAVQALRAEGLVEQLGRPRQHP